MRLKIGNTASFSVRILFFFPRKVNSYYSFLIFFFEDGANNVMPASSSSNQGEQSGADGIRTLLLYL